MHIIIWSGSDRKIHAALGGRKAAKLPQDLAHDPDTVWAKIFPGRIREHDGNIHH